MSQRVRLSQSGLWEKQRAYYHEKGVEAWNTGTVPHYITNNPLIATAYADLIVAQLEDLAAAEELQLDQPVSIVELGGGSGRLGYLILRRLEELREELPIRVRYVLTDFTETNLKHWEEHPCFAPFFEQGDLELACFDVENQETITLRTSGDVLDGSGNPVFFVANYLFDTLTMDAFRCWRGSLEEALPAIEYGEDGPSISFNYEPAPVQPYGIPEYDQILASYQERLGNTHFLFPTGPLACLKNLSRVSGGRMCLITADKAWARWEDLIDLEESIPVAHGPSFSMTVNFHAMEMYWNTVGGTAFHTSPRDSMLQISAFCSGLERADLWRTARAFADRMDRFGPLDFFNLKEALTASPEPKSLRLCLELLRMACWDPELLFELSEPLTQQGDSDLMPHKRELFLAVARTWKNYFPIGEPRDLPFEVARILFRIEYYEQSLEFYEESIRLFGKHKMTYHNMGLCYYYLRRLESAKDCFLTALDLDANYSPAREWLMRLEPEIHESGSFASV